MIAGIELSKMCMVNSQALFNSSELQAVGVDDSSTLNFKKANAAKCDSFKIVVWLQFAAGLVKIRTVYKIRFCNLLLPKQTSEGLSIKSCKSVFIQLTKKASFFV